jgi:hypothetical protein
VIGIGALTTTGVDVAVGVGVAVGAGVTGAVGVDDVEGVGAGVAGGVGVGFANEALTAQISFFPDLTHFKLMPALFVVMPTFLQVLPAFGAAACAALEINPMSKTGANKSEIDFFIGGVFLRY